MHTIKFPFIEKYWGVNQQKPPLCKGRWHAKRDGGIVIQRKHNKDIVPTAKMLRKKMTKEEKHLWYDFLRTYPVRFLRQKVLGRYIADFYCAEAKLVIELDGSGHYTEEGKQYDEERTAFLKEYGLTVIRIQNTEVHKNFRGVCEYIDRLVEQSLSQLRWQLPLHKGAFFMFTYDLSILLTSTAFMDTNSKYGIPLSRYTVFLRTVL